MRRRRVVAAALLAAASVTLSGCGFDGLYNAPLPGGASLGSHPFTITAHFDDVLDLVPQSAVKVNDVAVGKITAISLSGWHAKVTMQVNGEVDLPANARAEVLQTSLLGEKYIALEEPLGTSSKSRLTTGDNIPLNRTNSAFDIEQVLGALSLLLNQGGLQQIQVIARELNNALRGREGTVRALLTSLNTFVGTLDQQKDKITTALGQLATLSATLKNQETVLSQTLDTYPAALKVLADERTKFVTLLTSLSHLGSVATGVIDASQANTVSALKSLHPALTQLTAAGKNFPQSLRILGTFPFTLGKARTYVKGDYANLGATFDLNLSDELCGVLGSQIPTLCTTSGTVLGASTSKATTTSATTSGTGSSATQSGAASVTNPATAAVGNAMQPLLIGAGG